MIVIFGEGTLLTGIAVNNVIGKYFSITENPNINNQPGDEHAEFIGEDISCISEKGVMLHFKTVKDIDQIIKQLNELKGKL